MLTPSLAGALAGGYLGARVARLLPARVLRAGAVRTASWRPPAVALIF